MRRLLATAVVMLLVVVVLPAEQAARRFGLDDFSKVARVSDPQIAPDGRSVAVVVARPNLDDNRHDTELILVDVATGGEQKLVAGHLGVSSPRWSPDGRQLAFLAQASSSGGPLQVFVVRALGGYPAAITSAPHGVQQFAWSPDSKTVAFAAQDEPEAGPGWERFNRSFEVLPNTHMIATETIPPTHLWMVPASGGEAKRLTSGSWSLPVARPPGAPASAIAWTRDGSAVAFTRTGGAPTGRGGPVAGAPPDQGRGGRGGAGGVQLVRIADASIAPLGNVSGNHPQFAPVGDAVVSLTGGNASVVTAPGAEPRNLTEAIDRGIARALWLPDGRALVVGANDTERVSLWVQPLDGPARKIDLGDLSPSSSFFVDMTVGRDGALAFTASSPTSPTELYYMSSITGPVKRLTNVNTGIASLPLGRAEVINWTNEGFSENGILTLPPDFDPSRKYPLVLIIHGGPRAASMRTFSGPAQLMAAKGWLVFQPNYRGSDNLGNAYQAAIRGDAGAGPGRDVMTGIEAVKARGIVDDTRMAVSGWSYGGYMTTWMLGHYDIWRAAVTGASMTNQLDQYNLSDGARGGRGNDSPWVNPDVMQRMHEQSPIMFAKNIKAPTLVLHNIGDYRVTITQSFELYHALIDHGVTTRFVAYPIYGHNATDPVHQRDVQRRWIDWIEHHFNTPVQPGGGR